MSPRQGLVISCYVLFTEVSGERAWIKTEAEDPGAWAYGEVQVLSLFQ